MYSLFWVYWGICFVEMPKFLSEEGGWEVPNSIMKVYMVFDFKPRTNGESSVVAKVWDAMEY